MLWIKDKGNVVIGDYVVPLKSTKLEPGGDLTFDEHPIPGLKE